MLNILTNWLSTDLAIDLGRIILTVSDNGSGSASEIELFVFELLRTNKIDGMGIGFVVKQIHN